MPTASILLLGNAMAVSLDDAVEATMTDITFEMASLEANTVADSAEAIFQARRMT